MSDESSSPSKAPVASLSKNFYPHCLVIVSSRNRFECDLHEQPEGNADPALKPDFYIFLLIFQHKWMFLSTMQTLPFEGNNVACQCKGMLDQSNIVCKYEVNWSTNEKVITKKQKSL